MTQQETTTQKTTTPPHYEIDPEKLNKYLPKLLNGEAYKLRSILPRLLSTGGVVTSQVSRERYDYREQLLRRKEPSKHAMLLNNLIVAIENVRDDKDIVAQRLAEFKAAMDECFRKNNTKGF